MRIQLAEAIHYLQHGQVVAVPTETVYGLAASLNHLGAIQQIFALKGRPTSNPLIIHIASAQQVQIYAKELPPYFEELSEAFWPGPLTLITPIYPALVYPLVRAGLSTAAFRIPSHPLTLQVIRETGPLVMPSANLSGRPSATSPEHVEEDFGRVFPVLDGGVCEKGLESTILHYLEDQWVILRLGSLEPGAFQVVLGYEPKIIHPSDTGKPLAPGQLFRHYAPRAKLILGSETALRSIHFVLGFKERVYPEGKRVLCMGSLENPHEVGENLYKILRQLDQEGATTAWVDSDFPRHGLWITIAERLRRASE